MRTRVGKNKHYCRYLPAQILCCRWSPDLNCLLYHIRYFSKHPLWAPVPTLKESWVLSIQTLINVSGEKGKLEWSKWRMRMRTMMRPGTCASPKKRVVSSWEGPVFVRNHARIHKASFLVSVQSESYELLTTSDGYCYCYCYCYCYYYPYYSYYYSTTHLTNYRSNYLSK